MIIDNLNIKVIPAQLEEVYRAISEIKLAMPYRINLGPEERAQLIAEGEISLPFIRKAIGLAKQEPVVVPAFLDPGEMERDLEAAEMLAEVQSDLQRIVESLSDTVLALRAKSRNAALTIHGVIGEARRHLVPGIDSMHAELEDLRKAGPCEYIPDGYPAGPGPESPKAA